jgi:hypothetical protein
MRELTRTTKSNVSKTAAAIVLLSFGAACGNGGNDGSADAEGGNSKDGGDTADHGGVSSSDTGTGSDGANGGGGGTATDAESDGDVVDGGPIGSLFAVNLGTAGSFAILAKTGISTVPTSAVTGDLGVSPAAASYITGFSLIADSTNAFSTSPQVTGKVYASNYTAPTPSNLTTAIGDMQTAFTDAAGRAASVTGLGAGNIGGMTLAAGVYRWGTGLLIPTDVTLTGSATDVWIFQIAKNLTVSNATHVNLTGGALSKNVFWQVSGSVDLGTTSQFEGTILGQTAIALQTGASINGRLLAQSAVSIEGSTVVEPAM